jgi:hypothetical protein
MLVTSGRMMNRRILTRGMMNCGRIPRRMMIQRRDKLNRRRFALRQRLKSWKKCRRREQQDHRDDSREPRHENRDASMYRNLLCAGNLQPDFFRQPLADFFGQAVMYAPCSFFGSIEHRYWRRRGYRNHHPDQSRKKKSRECGDFQPESVGWAEMTDYAEGQQKNTGRKRGQRNKPDVNQAVYFLAVAAAFADREMSFVVAAHFQREAGDVITPACQNFSDNRINALLTHG